MNEHVTIDQPTRGGIVPQDVGQLPTRFEPQDARIRDAKADAVIAFAKRVKDWPLLEDAAERKLDELAELVGWWTTNVSPQHGAGRGNKKVADRGPFSVDDAEVLTGFTKQQVSRIRKRLKDRSSFRDRICGAAYKKALEEAGKVRGTQGTGENEWYTPKEYLDAAREVLGTIELDAASSPQAQELVKAERFFSARDDALKQEWHGKVWLNPPYSQPLIQQFVEKLVAEHGAGRTTEAILLTHNYTDTTWFHSAAKAARAICFTRGRIRFYDSDGELAAPTQGQAFCYLGEKPDGFAEIFGHFGFVVAPW